MAAALTLDEFKLRTTMPSEFVDSLELAQQGWVAAQLAQSTAWIYSRLRKRYAVPFTTPPETVKNWLTQLVTMACWTRRGYSPTDESMKDTIDAAALARTEVMEAADGVAGMFDLPVSDDATGAASAVSKGGPLGYSEQSPYVWADCQAMIGRSEDLNRQGSM